MINSGDIIGEDFIARRNHANLLTWRAFTKGLRLHADRIALLMCSTGRKRPTCHKYTEPIRERRKGERVTGSGLPSPLAQHFKSIRELFMREEAEGFRGISFSYEMARASLDFWEHLHRDKSKGDFRSKVVLLVREVGVLQFKLGGRQLSGIPVDEKQELHHLLLNAKALVGELEWMVGEDIGETVAEYTGSPMPKDRRVKGARPMEAALTRS